MALSKRHSTRCGVEFIGNAKPRVIVACSPRPGAALSDPHRNQETNLRTPIPDDIVMRAGKKIACASAGVVVASLTRASQARFVEENTKPAKMKTNTTKLKFDRRLGTYLTLGVGAGVLGSQSSNAAIVYFDVTPMTLTSGQRGWVNPALGTTGTSGVNATPTIGLNFSGANYIYSVTEDSGDGTTTIAFDSAGGYNAMSRFASNATIGASSTFKQNWSYMDRSGWTTAESAWATGADGTSGYVGFSFDNSGTANYGWIAVTYNAASQTLEMGDFAYENSGGSILAGNIGAIPEPSSLGLLALGAAGLLARRRRQAA